MELARALKLIVDNKDVDPEMFNLAVHTTLHDTATEIRNRLERTNPNSTKHGGQWLWLGEVYTGPMKKTRDNSTFQWSSGFTIGNHCEIDIMVTVNNFGTYSHEPSIKVKLVDADKSIRYTRDVWFKDNGCSLIHDMVKDAIESLQKPETDQTLETIEYAVSVGGGLRTFVSDTTYDKVTSRLDEATRYKCFSDALDKAEELRNRHIMIVQIHEIKTEGKVGRTVTV